MFQTMYAAYSQVQYSQQPMITQQQPAIQMSPYTGPQVVPQQMVYLPPQGGAVPQPIMYAAPQRPVAPQGI